MSQSVPMLHCASNPPHFNSTNNVIMHAYKYIYLSHTITCGSKYNICYSHCMLQENAMRYSDVCVCVIGNKRWVLFGTTMEREIQFQRMIHTHVCIFICILYAHIQPNTHIRTDLQSLKRLLYPPVRKLYVFYVVA